MSTDVNIRQAKIYDVPAISRIETDSFDDPWSAESITKDVTAGEGVYVAVAESEGEKAGFAEMRIIAGEAQVFSIAVDSKFRGRGIGEALLKHLIEKSRESSCTKLTLEVRAGNEAAASLYEKLGFREVGKRKGYYSNGSEDAVLMDLDLAASEGEEEQN